jgi:hypothetical protein
MNKCGNNFDECIICFNEINRREQFIRCNICNVIGHSRCLKEWWILSNKNIKCVVCQQKKCFTEENINFFKQCFGWCFGVRKNKFLLLN